MEVWGVKVLNDHFGDTWRVLGAALIHSTENNCIVGINFQSERAKKDAPIILAELDSPGSIEFVNDKPTRWIDVNKWVPSVPTKKKWCGDKAVKKIAYQFDGIFRGDLKNPPIEHQEWFFEYMKNQGYELLSMEGKNGTKEPIDIAAQVSCFVGCCSGASQICYSVGTPAFIFRYRLDTNLFFNWHKNKATATDETLQQIVKVHLEPWLIS